jgi:hypothetical protein
MKFYIVLAVMAGLVGCEMRGCMDERRVRQAREQAADDLAWGYARGVTNGVEAAVHQMLYWRFVVQTDVGRKAVTEEIRHAALDEARLPAN